MALPTNELQHFAAYAWLDSHVMNKRDSTHQAPQKYASIMAVRWAGRMGFRFIYPQGWVSIFFVHAEQFFSFSAARLCAFPPLSGSLFRPTWAP